MSKPARKYLTAADAAEYVGYAPNTLAQYRCRGIGPPYRKVRGRVLYAVADLDDWVEEQSAPFEGLTSPAEVASV